MTSKTFLLDFSFLGAKAVTGFWATKEAVLRTTDYSQILVNFHTKHRNHVFILIRKAIHDLEEIKHVKVQRRQSIETTKAAQGPVG